MKKQMANQRKIYERLFTEGYKLEDARKIIERYMEKEMEKSECEVVNKAKTTTVNMKAPIMAARSSSGMQKTLV